MSARRLAALTRALATVLATVLATAGCGGRDERPSVLLVTIDTLRADAVSAWGIERGTTPHLDALATSGTRFESTTTVTPLTLPAHASLLTGWRPARHGLTVNGVALPGLPVATLAAELSAAGWSTAAFVSSAVLDRRHGLGAGFDHYDDDLLVPGGPLAPHERRGDHTVDAAVDWISQAREPWFVWVHLYDAHAPYEAPGGGRGDDRAAYLDEVRFADAQLGRMLQAVDHAARGPLLVVVTSDHGESLGQHGERTHGVLIGEGAMAVPLVLAWRGQPASEGFPAAGQVRRDVASVLDVAPTVLTAVGLAPAGDLDGRALQSAPDEPRILPLECRSPAFYYGFSSLAGLRRGPLKVVGAIDAEPPGWTLYDLATDPLEQHGRPVRSDDPLLKAVRSPRPTIEATPALDPERMRALGYLTGAVPDDGAPRRDPRGAMDLVDGIDAANTALVRADAVAARAALAGLLERYGDVSELYLLLGRVARLEGDLPAADTALARACALQPGSGESHSLWGKILLERAVAGDVAPDRVRAVLGRALELLPEDSETVALLALTDVVFGDPEAALSRLEPALERRPRAVNLLVVQLRALRAAGRLSDAARVEATLRQLAPDLLGD